ncbi:MAG: bifunctional 4-hydroxy-2-oxoglutarate aldolase/2-dehydro-3-deoxy-phosphogluconate aldolase [Planctomycetota bacterium]
MTNKQRTIDALCAAGIVAVVRTDSASQAAEVVKALAAGGVLASEITFTVPGAVDAIAAVRDIHGRDELPEGLVLGAGTVVTAEQANEAVEAGARYLVSPHTSEAVMRVAAERDVAVMPGALTPGEVFRAFELGADVVKIFPAARMGPSYLKDLRGPFPDIPLMPTGGVSVANVHEWIDAGAVAVGVGGELVHKPSVAAGDWQELTRRAQVMVAALREARSKAKK